MIRVAAFLAAWLIAAPAWAFLAGQPVGMLNPQVQPANASAGLPAVDDNLAAGGYPIAGGVCAEWGHQVPCNNHYSTTRASTKYVAASDGLYTSVASNVFALGSGVGGWPEEARTNDALWSRDMTNAAWVKTTMTTALNAIGIDGTANSATTLTATGASAMAVQTITLASQADNYSVFLKRITGSGTINLCLAATACGTATACTVTSTTAFTRCTVTATVLNPIVGIQIVTNGDAVIADFNQMEPGGIPTSPCLTTNATCTRSADSIVLAGAALAAMLSTSGTAKVYGQQQSSANFQYALIAGNSGGNFGFTSKNGNTGANASSFLNGVGNAAIAARAFVAGVNETLTVTWKQGAYGLSISGAATVTSAQAGALTFGGSTYTLGSVSGGNYFDSPIQRVSLWTTQFQNSQLPGM